jgi:hypothetical protein
MLRSRNGFAFFNVKINFSGTGYHPFDSTTLVYKFEHEELQLSEYQ